MAIDDKLVNFHRLATGGDFGEWNEFAGNASDEAGIEGVFLDFFLEDLLDDLVVFHLFGNLDAEFVALLATCFRSDVEEIIAGDFFDEVVIVSALPRAL